jgi:hypothetical protein
MNYVTSKRKTDFLKGKSNIHLIIDIVNDYMISKKSSYRMAMKHPLLKLMPVYELTKNNTLFNRMFNTPFSKAVGLNCYIYDVQDPSHIRTLLIRYSDDFGFYVKIPTDAKTNPKVFREFWNLLESHYVLFVKRINSKAYPLFYGPVPIKEIMKSCKHYVSSSKGNTNRLQFDYNPAKLAYQVPESTSLFEGDLKDRINYLFK